MNSQPLLKWLRANLGKHCTAALTSHDVKALTASVALCPLISHTGAAEGLFAAYRAIVLEMQPHLRGLAYHAIAMELDWSHREMIWTLASLPDADRPKTKCQFES